MTNLGKVACRFVGEYSNTTQYEGADIVSFKGATYGCRQPCIGIDPTNTAYWQYMGTVSVATASNVGVVKPDNTSIVVDADGTLHGSAQYELPVASTTTLGGVKVDDDSIVATPSGVISAPNKANKTVVSEKWVSKGYSKGANVIDDDIYYECLLDHATGLKPKDNPTYWKATNTGAQITQINNDLSDKTENVQIVDISSHILNYKSGYVSIIKLGKIAILNFSNLILSTDTTNNNLSEYIGYKSISTVNGILIGNGNVCYNVWIRANSYSNSIGIEYGIKAGTSLSGHITFMLGT